MDGQYATKQEIWSIQESINDLSTTQQQHAERIMRIERRRDDDGRVKNVWAPPSPFASVLGSSHASESTLNPTAEAFRNFDSEPNTAMMSSLTLDSTDDGRRVAASRANSVRFDESANNHYSPSSRQSIDLPARTGSGLGTHPLSERSLSHRSDGRTSTTGFSQRTNSFGIEGSRLLGSINNSPRLSGNPPPGFNFIGPFPSIVRCWLTETFSHSSLLLAAICSGSMDSSISSSLVDDLKFADQIFEENGTRKVKLPVYFTEARIRQASSRSASPVGHVPFILGKFQVVERSVQDVTIQIIIGSDILRSHNADIMFSQERLIVFDEDRNQLVVPLIRPENDAVYKNLMTSTSQRQNTASHSISSPHAPPEPQSPVGIIGRPSRLVTEQTAASPPTSSGSLLTSAAPSETGDRPKAMSSDAPVSSGAEMGQSRTADDAKSVTSSEKSFTTTPTTRSSSGVWAQSWRSSSGTGQSDKSAPSTTASSYARAGTGTSARSMKILRPSTKVTSIASRTGSNASMTANGSENAPLQRGETDPKATQLSGGSEKPAAPTKSNPVGGASAFGWLNSGRGRNNVNGE